MTIVDIIEETYSALSGNKVRSGLTMLGIIIGISSVIAMVAIGQGAQGSIQSSIQSIGSNLVLVMPGQQRGAGTQISAGRGSARSLTQGDASRKQLHRKYQGGIRSQARVRTRTHRSSVLPPHTYRYET